MMKTHSLETLPVLKKLPEPEQNTFVVYLIPKDNMDPFTWGKHQWSAL